MQYQKQTCSKISARIKYSIKIPVSVEKYNFIVEMWHS